jgi:hypothetical protein
MKQFMTVVDENPLFFTAWMDKKPVHLLSTFAASRDTVRRASRTNAGAYAQVEDRLDQKMLYYRTKLRTKHWKRKIYVHLLNIAVVNGHILYRDSRRLGPSDDNFRLISFQEKLISELGFPQRQEPPPDVLNVRPGRRRSLQICLADMRRCQGFHEPLLHRRRAGDPDLRKTCIYCNKKDISSMCVTCNVPLCLKSSFKDDSCFALFHNAPVTNA